MTHPPRPSPDADQLALLPLVNVALRRRWLVVQVIVLVVAVVAAVTLLRPRTYTTSTSFRPQARTGSNTSALPGLVAQLGLLSPLAADGQSPAFYVDLLKSRQVLGAAVDSKYPSAERPADTSTVLADVFKVRGRTPAVRREQTMEELADAMDVLASPKTGVITLSVTLKDPVLAEAVTRRLLDALHRFNLESRQSQARAERRFTERRLEEVRLDLRAAEDQLQLFLQRNRDYRNSPSLTFQQERLMREVTMQQALYGNLAQTFEQARIEEVRDTPVLTVIDPPVQPAQPDPRGLIKRGILAVVLGGVFGLGLAFAREGLARAREHGSPEFRELSELRQGSEGRRPQRTPVASPVPPAPS